MNVEAQGMEILPVFPPGLRVVDRRGRLPRRADGVPYRRRDAAAILGVVVHATEADAPAESLALYQTTKLEGDPYPAIAYHFVIHPDGGVEWCHDLAVETWHAGAWGSARYVAVCFGGAGGEAPATAAQVAAGRALLAALARAVGRPLEARPHHALLPAAAHCPGPSWTAWGGLLDGDAAPEEADACTT